MARKRVKAHKRKNGVKVKAYKRTVSKAKRAPRTDKRVNVLHSHRIPMDKSLRSGQHVGDEPYRRF